MITALIHTEMKSFEDLALNFAQKELAQRREASDRYPFGPFDEAILAKAHELGFLGITLPEDLGGIGQGISTLCVVLEGISRTDASLAALIFTNTLSQELMLRSGAAEMLGKITQARTPQDVLIAYPAYSDPLEHKSLPQATKGKKGYTLAGTLDYVVLAPIASQALVPARIAGQEAYSLFLVDLTSAQVKKSAPVFSLGVHACPASDIVLDGAQGQLVGREGGGPECFEAVANMLYAPAAAISVGIMKGAFDYALAYCNEREQGGWPIVNWSEIKMILSDMAINMRVSDLAASQACAAIEQKLPGWDICAKTAALFAQEAACQATTDGIQVLGGYGYMKDYGQEKRFRDAKQVKTLLGMAPIRKIELLDRLNAQR